MKNLIILLSLIITSCSGNKSESKESVGSQQEQLKLYVFDVGEIRMSDISIFNTGETGPKLLTNSSYLIRHPKGDLIWDTGYYDSLNNDPKTTSKTLISQLGEINVQPADIEYLAFSHLHPDHIGNGYLFTSSRILLQKEEYDSLFNGNPVTEDVKALKNNPYTRLQGDHDVFGDGSVIIKRTPGHTDGHQMLLIRLRETGPILLSGDLYIYKKQHEMRAIPDFNVDKEQSAETMKMVDNFLIEEKATLWIQHDFEQNQEIAHAPEFHR